ncbi:MAG: glycosyltransferase family 1 protein [Actinomycetota bacterium]
MSLRVGIDVTPLCGPPTGIHRVTRSLIEELAHHADIEVTGWLLTSRGAVPDVAVDVRRSRVPARLAQMVWARSALLGRTVTGPVDVAHGPNFMAPPRPTSVVSLQDLTPITHPEWCRPEVAAMAPAIRRAVASGATIHVSSRLVGDEARAHLDASDEQIRLVHHAVDAPVPADAATGHGVAGTDRYLLSLGTIEHRKNVVAAVRALRAVPEEISLVIAGHPGNAEDELVAALADVDPARVRRLPVVDDHTRSALLRGATALLWPSRYEGFALPPLEALRVGTPVVATAVGALPELVGDTIALVRPGDDDAFTEAVAEIVDGDHAVPTAIVDRIADLTWERAAAEMAAIYRDVAGR